MKIWCYTRTTFAWGVPPNKAETPMHPSFYNNKIITDTEVAQDTLVNKARG